MLEFDLLRYCFVSLQITMKAIHSGEIPLSTTWTSRDEMLWLPSIGTFSFCKPCKVDSSGVEVGCAI